MASRTSSTLSNQSKLTWFNVIPDAYLSRIYCYLRKTMYIVKHAIENMQYLFNFSFVPIGYNENITLHVNYSLPHKE